MRFLRTLPVPLALIAMIGLAGAALGRVYADPLLVQLVLGAAIGSVGVSVGARRLPSWLVAPLSVLALVGYAAVALWLAAQRAELPGGFAAILADAARNGIPRLLTAMIPVEPSPDTVVVPLFAAWLTGLAGAEVALRAGRVLLGLVPPAALYAGALYVVGPNADPTIWLTVAFAAAGVLALAVTGRPAPTTGPDTPDGPASDLAPGVRAALRLRMAVSTAAGLAVVLALAAAVAPLVAHRVGATPVDPRRYVQPPQVDSLDENPLIRISGWALNPDQKLLDVSTTGGSGPGPAAPSPSPADDGASGDEPAPDESAPDESAPAGPESAGLRIRLAVLNDYDGVTWRVGATYRNAGRVLPEPEPLSGAQVETIQQEITIADLTGRLLPAVSTPQEVTGARVAYDLSSGTLIRPEGLASGLRYSVTSRREVPDFNLLTTANVPAGDEVARFLRVEAGVPEQLQQLAEQIASEHGSPYARAGAIETYLSEHYRMVADAPSGHAYPNLNFFLFGPSNGGGQRGTSEQFAAAYAVLGRIMGLPTRVVVGFDSPTGTGPVRGADAVAWPEVLFEELGWVAFNPLPRPNTQPQPVEEIKPDPKEPPPPPDDPGATPEPSASASAAAAPGRNGRGGSAVPVLVGGGTGGMLLLLAGLVLAVTSLRRAQQRRRLDQGTPAQRIAGAWREVTDALRLAGRPVPSHLAATEVAEHAGSAVGEPTGVDRDPAVPPIDDLAVLVNLAAFAPGHATDDQARRAAELALAYARGLRAERPWWRRMLWSLHPGPLRWRD